MAYTHKKIPGIFMILVTFLLATGKGSSQISVSTKHLKMQVQQMQEFQLLAKNLSLDGDGLRIKFVPQHADIVRVVPENYDISEENVNYTFTVLALSAGKSEVNGVSSRKIDGHDGLFLSVEVYESRTIETVSTIIGWMYFVAWAGSYYPQLYSNFRRKSVVGLNFDFLAYNVVGYSMYSVFNFGLYYIPAAKEEYFRRHPRSLNPVLENDLVFVIHGTFASLLTGIQALIYEKKDQSMSVFGRGMCGVYGLAFFASIGLVAMRAIHLLDFLYVCSFIKLVVTVTKYVPQAYMNYSRKSTEGWSIGNVILDFIGGVGSLLQMFLNAYNYHDPHSVIENPTKFGLAALTILFDVLFMCQHFVLYNGRSSASYKDPAEAGSEEAFLEKV